MLLQDATNHSPVCFLTPPTSHLIATPCNPIYALNSKEHTLFLKGGPIVRCLCFVELQHCFVSFRRQILMKLHKSSKAADPRLHDINVLYLKVLVSPQAMSTPAAACLLKEKARISFSSFGLESVTPWRSILFHPQTPNQSIKHWAMLLWRKAGIFTFSKGFSLCV